MNRQVSLQPPLRYATLNDCWQLAELAEFAGEGIPSYFWQQSAVEGEAAIEVGMRNLASEDENFSYRNAVVHDQDGEIRAMLLAYRLVDEAGDVELEEIPELVRPLVELELLVPGTFYINMIASYPQYRGRGYGSQLLDAAHPLAAAEGCNELSIEVFEQNQGAARLYLRKGFQVIASRQATPHECYPFDGKVLLMTRKVELD